MTPLSINDVATQTRATAVDSVLANLVRLAGCKIQNSITVNPHDKNPWVGTNSSVSKNYGEIAKLRQTVVDIKKHCEFLSENNKRLLRRIDALNDKNDKLEYDLQDLKKLREDNERLAKIVEAYQNAGSKQRFSQLEID